MKDFKKITLPIPPLPEQQKIASILTTVDDKISSIEAQIQQTEQLKKGLMAKLLTEGIGHTEFKDTEIGRIPKEWEIKQLDTISQVTMGQSPSSQNYNEENKGLPLIQGNADIKNRVTNPRIWSYEITKTCEINDILMTVRAPVGAIAISKHKACIGRGICSIKPIQCNSNLLYQILLSFESKWKNIEQGSTFTAVNGNDIKSLKIPLPPLPEQQQIASILSSVDDKIDILQSKKSAYTTLKKGLMAKLLTGQMRVKI